MQLPQGTLSCCAIHLVKTILNRVQKFKSFVYESVRWVEEAQEPTLEVELRLRSNGRVDRFHIMSHMSKALDQVRAQEARTLKEQGYERC